MSPSVANLQMLEQTACPADGAFEVEPGHIETLVFLLLAWRKNNRQRLAHKIQHLTKGVLKEVRYTARCSAIHAPGNSATRH